MRKIKLYIIFCFLGKICAAQDIHFSQFFNAPMLYNPALTGQFDGDYRFTAQHRTQWRSVDAPYNTFGLSADSPTAVPLTDLGTGLAIFQDRAGDSRLNTFQINASGSYPIPVFKDSLQSLRGGLQLGFTSLSINYDALQFDAQYDGLAYNPGLNNRETFATNRRGYLNANVGLSYFKKWNNRKSFSGGISLFNLTKPKQSLYNDLGVTLDRRFVAQANASLPINNDWSAEPGVVLQLQGKARELLIGGAAKYTLLDDYGLYRAVYGGLYTRAGDAGYIYAGLVYDQWAGGISYDFNWSKLREASNGRGGLEISVTYIFKKPAPPKIGRRDCPDFI